MMRFIEKHYRPILWSIPLISIALHFHIFNLDLIGIHVWRQTETQTVINNFYKESFNIFNPRINDCTDASRIMRKEFPLMQWIFALFYKIFGAHIIITRLLSFVVGLFSVYGLFYLSCNIFKNKVTATICAWCFNFSPVFYYYTLNPMPDNLALCCAIWSIGLFYHYINTSSVKYVFGSALCLGLATLMKLPFILYGSFPFIFLLMQLRNRKYSTQPVATFFIYLLFILPAIAWYLWVIPEWHNGVIKGALDIKQSPRDWLYILWGNIISVLPELIINYGSVLFFIAGFYFMIKNKLYRNDKFYLFCFWGISIIFYFVYELNMIDTVHDYYLFPFLPLIFLMVSYGAYYLLASQNRLLRILTLLCLSVLPLSAFLRIDSRWDTKEPGFNPTYYKYKTELRNLTPRDAYCIVCDDPSNYILLYYIDRKGWAFRNYQINDKILSNCIAKGAGYIFLDRHVDEMPGVKIHLDKVIFDKENLLVYKLK